MKRQLSIGCFSLVILFLLAGCVEKTGYYEPGEQQIIDNLTGNKSWERDFYVERDGGFDVHETWVFKDDGSGSCEVETTYNNGQTEERLTYFRWSFTMPDFSVIYLDYGLFWDVKKLTSDKLYIYETYDDPVTVPGQTYRGYKEYDAYPLIDEK